MASRAEMKKWKYSKKLSEKEMKNIVARIYRILENHADKFVLGKSEIDSGYIEYHCGDKRGTSIDCIFLDYRDDIFSTLIHECLHYLYPNHKEKQIRRLEARFMKTIESTRVKNILHRFAVNVCIR